MNENRDCINFSQLKQVQDRTFDVFALCANLFNNVLMKKISRKDRPVIIFVAIALGLVLARPLIERGIAFHLSNPGGPMSKEDQQTLLKTQEQEDELGESGPLKAKVSATDAQDTVLNLKTFGTSNLK